MTCLFRAIASESRCHAGCGKCRVGLRELHGQVDLGLDPRLFPSYLLALSVALTLLGSRFLISEMGLITQACVTFAVARHMKGPCKACCMDF